MKPEDAEHLADLDALGQRTILITRKWGSVVVHWSSFAHESVEGMISSQIDGFLKRAGKCKKDVVKKCRKGRVRVQLDEVLYANGPI